MPPRKSKKPNNNKRQSILIRIGFFMIGFSAIGGGIMLYKSSAATTWASPYKNPHGAECVAVRSKAVVKPGEKFTAVVEMKNVGTSTFSERFAVYLSEFNNGTATNYWNVSGGSLLSNDILPNQTATFNLSLTAPAEIGNHDFNWAMAIVWSGAVYNPCTGHKVLVLPPPSVSLSLNGQNNNIAVTQGSGLTINWSATPLPTSCTASDNWSGSKSPPTAGSQNITADTSTPGTKTYSLQCSNAYGPSTKVSRTVVVNPAPTTSLPPTSGSVTSPPKTTSPSSITPRRSSSSPLPAVVVDTSPPSAPTNFQVAFTDSVVNLSWDASTDDFGIAGYELERSSNQTDWQKIGNNISGESYSDSDVGYQSTYYYRLKALDESGNISPSVTAQITTGSFEPNVQAEDGIVLTSDDGVVQVTIPVSALNEQASCDLRQSNILHPGIEKFVSISGPYELICKLESGEKVRVFKEPVTVKIILNDSQNKQYSDLKIFTMKNDWEEVLDISEDSSFVLGDSTDFAIMGKINKTPLWQKILIILFIVSAIIGGGLAGLTQLYRWRLRKQIEQQNQNNYNKERGY